MSKVDLARLIEETIPLERRSGRLFGRCPFHEEKSPSFTIYNDHYYCFGCKASGDAIDYVRHTHGLSFVDALKHLAQKFSVVIPELDKTKQWSGDKRKTAEDYRALSLAQKWFVTQLYSPQGQKSRDYLKMRGFSDENIKLFGFGFAPDDFQSFITAMEKEDIKAESLLATSLAKASTRGHSRPYAFFRNRLMVPIRDTMGRVIAFGGRTLGDDPAKYVNSSETTLFDKSNTLYGLFEARDAIRKENLVYVVEGYMDTLKLWQNDIRNTVACMGTALTTKQLSQLSHFASEVILCFDGDTAGMKANLNTVSHALEVPKIAVSVMRLPQGEDPDSFISREGREAFLALKENSKDLLSFAIEAKLSEHKGLSLPHVISKEFIPWLSRIHDQMQRSYLMLRIHQMTGVPIGQLEREFASQTGHAPRSNPPPKRLEVAAKRDLDAAQFELFGHIYFAQPGDLQSEPIMQFMSNELVLEEAWLVFARDMFTSLEVKQISPYQDDKSLWMSAADERVVAVMRRFATFEKAFSGTHHGEAVQKIITAHSRERHLATLKALKKRLAVADPEEQFSILREIQALKQQHDLAQDS